MGFEIGRQIDNIDGGKRALLDTDTTSYAQTLRDEGDFGVGCDFYAELACPHDGAGFLAFLAAFLGRKLALFEVPGYQHQFFTFGLHW